MILALWCLTALVVTAAPAPEWPWGQTVAACAEAEGSPASYLWRVESPRGELTEGADRCVEVALLTEGVWQLTVEVGYAHEAPGGGPYTTGAAVTVTVGPAPSLVFGDGFEAGDLSAWSRAVEPLWDPAPPLLGTVGARAIWIDLDN